MVKSFESEWRARFERYGRTHREEHAISGWSPEGLRRRVQLFDRVIGSLDLPPRADALEMGCGAGTYVRRLAGLGHAAVGVDYALTSLARAVAADPGRTGRYLAAEAYQLPFGGESFDLVTCIGVLQALSQPELVLTEMARVLRPGGFVVVEALNPYELAAMARRTGEIVAGRPPRLRFYSPYQVREWLKEPDIRVRQKRGVYLPPRRLPGLGWCVGSWLVSGVLDRLRPASLLLAHAIWLVGQKAS